MPQQKVAKFLEDILLLLKELKSAVETNKRSNSYNSYKRNEKLYLKMPLLKELWGKPDDENRYLFFLGDNQGLKFICNVYHSLFDASKNKEVSFDTIKNILNEEDILHILKFNYKWKQKEFINLILQHISVLKIDITKFNWTKDVTSLGCLGIVLDVACKLPEQFSYILKDFQKLLLMPCMKSDITLLQYMVITLGIAKVRFVKYLKLLNDIDRTINEESLKNALLKETASGYNFLTCSAVTRSPIIYDWAMKKILDYDLKDKMLLPNNGKNFFDVALNYNRCDDTIIIHIIKDLSCDVLYNVIQNSEVIYVFSKNGAVGGLNRIGRKLGNEVYKKLIIDKCLLNVILSSTQLSDRVTRKIVNHIFEVFSTDPELLESLLFTKSEEGYLIKYSQKNKCLFDAMMGGVCIYKGLLNGSNIKLLLKYAMYMQDVIDTNKGYDKFLFSIECENDLCLIKCFSENQDVFQPMFRMVNEDKSVLNANNVKIFLKYAMYKDDAIFIKNVCGKFLLEVLETIAYDKNKNSNANIFLGYQCKIIPRCFARIIKHDKFVIENGILVLHRYFEGIKYGLISVSKWVIEWCNSAIRRIEDAVFDDIWHESFVRRYEEVLKIKQLMSEYNICGNGKNGLSLLDINLNLYLMGKSGNIVDDVKKISNYYKQVVILDTLSESSKFSGILKNFAQKNKIDIVYTNIQQDDNSCGDNTLLLMNYIKDFKCSILLIRDQFGNQHATLVVYSNDKKLLSKAVCEMINDYKKEHSILSNNSFFAHASNSNCQIILDDKENIKIIDKGGYIYSQDEYQDKFGVPCSNINVLHLGQDQGLISKLKDNIVKVTKFINSILELYIPAPFLIQNLIKEAIRLYSLLYMLEESSQQQLRFYPFPDDLYDDPDPWGEGLGSQILDNNPQVFEHTIPIYGNITHANDTNDTY